VKELVGEIFSGAGKRARLIEDESKLGEALREALQPDFATMSGAPFIGFIHRRLADAEVYFVANTSNHDVTTKTQARVENMNPEVWDPFTGETEPCATEGEKSGTVILKLAPYESRLLVFSKKAVVYEPVQAKASEPQTVDISTNWRLTFGNGGQADTVSLPNSWTNAEQTRFFSGKATYEKSVEVSQDQLGAGRKVVLDFGPGETVQPSGPPGAPGTRALLESPVRECALIYVSGKLAGSVWHPPFELDITKAMHTGSNAIRMVVANAAINEIAGRALPNYRLLNLRYGKRFTPQGFENLKPIPSGILSSVRLVSR
jgi:hypothetical protein